MAKPPAGCAICDAASPRETASQLENARAFPCTAACCAVQVQRSPSQRLWLCRDTFAITEKLGHCVCIWWLSCLDCTLLPPFPAARIGCRACGRGSASSSCLCCAQSNGGSWNEEVAVKRTEKQRGNNRKWGYIYFLWL